MSLKSRMILFIEELGLNPKSFEERVGLSNGAVSKMGDNTRMSTIDKITDIFPALNKTWLLTGEGEMLKSDNDESESSKRIPVYDVETTGGSSGLVSSSRENANIVGYVDSGSWFENKETAIIRHVGDSMTEYPDGCWLAVKRVLNPRLLVPGRNYVIETDEFRVTKRIQKGSEKGYIKLYSTNQERYEDGQLIHEPFEVHLSDVRRIFSVLGYVVNQSGEIQFV
ncbi:MAG: hypothetical protein HDS59_08355 [Barnesiella sp.]|nr:hypothetical protein [Barnesiella sp.]